MDHVGGRKSPRKLGTLTCFVPFETGYEIFAGSDIEPIFFTLENVEVIHQNEPLDALRLLEAFLEALGLARFEQAQRVEKWRWRESNPRPLGVQKRRLHA